MKPTLSEGQASKKVSDEASASGPTPRPLSHVLLHSVFVEYLLWQVWVEKFQKAIAGSTPAVVMSLLGEGWGADSSRENPQIQQIVAEGERRESDPESTVGSSASGPVVVDTTRDRLFVIHSSLSPV